jgi:hypothetical protein
MYRDTMRINTFGVSRLEHAIEKMATSSFMSDAHRYRVGEVEVTRVTEQRADIPIT